MCLCVNYMHFKKTFDNKSKYKTCGHKGKLLTWSEIGFVSKNQVL